MKIKRFNESVYSEEIDNYIKRNDYDKEQVKYYLTKMSEKPENGASFKYIEDAIEHAENYYKMFDKSELPHVKKYIIYKTTIQAVSEEEINMIQNSKKFNL